MAIGITVLRHRVYGIDQVISRTVASAIVTGLLVRICAGLVPLATQVLGVHSPVAAAMPAAASPVQFGPAPGQHRVDRRFNRAAMTPRPRWGYVACAARLRDAVNLDSTNGRPGQGRGGGSGTRPRVGLDK